jgi:hypothetical protein
MHEEACDTHKAFEEGLRANLPTLISPWLLQVNRLSHADRPSAPPQPGATKKRRLAAGQPASDELSSDESRGEWWRFLAARAAGAAPVSPAARVVALRRRLAPAPFGGGPPKVPSTRRLLALYEALASRLPDKRRHFPDLNLAPLTTATDTAASDQAATDKVAPASQGQSEEDWAGIGSGESVSKGSKGFALCGAGGGVGDEVRLVGGCEEALLAEVEAALPVEAAAAARQRAAVALSVAEARRRAEADAKRRADKAAKVQSSKGGWFSGWGKGKNGQGQGDEKTVRVRAKTRAQFLNT